MSLPVYLAVFGVMLIAATTQSSIGFGQGLIAAPLLRLLHPELLPGPIVLAGFLTGLGVWYRNSERHDLPIVLPAVGGRIIGGFIAVALLLALSDRGLSIAIGAIVISFVVLRLLDVKIARTRTSLVGAGVTSGVSGTVAALGGAPMALLYSQHADARNFRGPMGWYTLFGTSLSIPFLMLADEFDTDALLLGLTLLPPVVLGFVAAKWVTPIVDRGYLKPLVLILSGGSATVLIATELVGAMT